MIDIIIPVYNSRNNLEQTLDNVAKQCCVSDVNLYIIDDGSIEEYSDIIEKYNKQISITYKKLDNNYGPGYARQVGLDISKGEYVTFLDSDDSFVNASALQKLCDTIKDSDADMVSSVVYRKLEWGFCILDNDPISLHGKIYRRSFIEEKNIKFNLARSNEDAFFNGLIKLFGAKQYEMKELTYDWHDTPGSLSNMAGNEIVDFEQYAYNSYNSLQIGINKNVKQEIIDAVATENLLYIASKYRATGRNFNNLNLEYVKKIYNILNKTNVDDIYKIALHSGKSELFIENEFELKELVSYLNEHR